jgi:hypothetical protein
MPTRPRAVTAATISVHLGFVAQKAIMTVDAVPD